MINNIKRRLNAPLWLPLAKTEQNHDHWTTVLIMWPKSSHLSFSSGWTIVLLKGSASLLAFCHLLVNFWQKSLKSLMMFVCCLFLPSPFCLMYIDTLIYMQMHLGFLCRLDKIIVECFPGAARIFLL
jgi:hypothetical protein